MPPPDVWSANSAASPPPETDLAQVEFVIVDLETTGDSPVDAAITEVGAVRWFEGAVIAEFQTLVNPRREIPTFIALLTGITDEMVSVAPAIDRVLPSFLEFASGAVLVAHHAPFDLGFLTAAAAKLRLTWPELTVIDTVPLARKLLLPGEVRDHKLATLAARFASPTLPDHRALADAQATAHVLSELLQRLISAGGHTLADLVAAQGDPPGDRTQSQPQP